MGLYVIKSKQTSFSNLKQAIHRRLRVPVQLRIIKNPYQISCFATNFCKTLKEKKPSFYKRSLFKANTS